MRPVELRGLTFGANPIFIATAIAKTVEGMVDATAAAWRAGADCVELRIDQLASESDVVRLVRATDAPHLVACRPPAFGGFFAGGEEARIDRLEAAVEAGAAAVDVEYFTEPPLRDRLIERARAAGTPLLIGYENMIETPSVEVMSEGLRSVASLRPDLVKLAVRANGSLDLLALLRTTLEANTWLDVPYAAIALGPQGAPSRPLALCFGGSFTYCAVDDGGAPGQLTVSETRSIFDWVSEQRWSCSSS